MKFIADVGSGLTTYNDLESALADSKRGTERVIISAFFQNLETCLSDSCPDRLRSFREDVLAGKYGPIPAKRQPWRFADDILVR